MQLTGLDSFLWALGLVLHLTLFLVLWLRSRIREFPAFTALIILNLLRSFVLYAALRLGTPKTYFVLYWSIGILDVGLQLGVVAEIASHVFRPLGTWSRETRRSFFLLFGLSLAVASVITWLAAPATTSVPQAVVLRGDFLSSALMAELFVGMTVLSVSRGLPWKTHVARIAQGLGVFSLCDILIEGANNFHGLAAGAAAYTTLSHFRIFVYIGCTAYWIAMLYRDAPMPKELPDVIRRELYSLQARLTQDLQMLRSWKS